MYHHHTTAFIDARVADLYDTAARVRGTRSIGANLRVGHTHRIGRGVDHNETLRSGPCVRQPAAQHTLTSRPRRIKQIFAAGLATLALASGIALIPAHSAHASSGKRCIPELTFFTDKCPH